MYGNRFLEAPFFFIRTAVQNDEAYRMHIIDLPKTSPVIISTRHAAQANRHPIATRKETFEESCVRAQQNHVHERHEDPRAAMATNVQEYTSGSQKLATHEKQAEAKPTNSQMISGEYFAVAIFSWNTLIRKNPITMKTATNAVSSPEKSLGPMGKTERRERAVEKALAKPKMPRRYSIDTFSRNIDPLLLLPIILRYPLNAKLTNRYLSKKATLQPKMSLRKARRAPGNRSKSLEKPAIVPITSQPPSKENVSRWRPMDKKRRRGDIKEAPQRAFFLDFPLSWTNTSDM